MNIKKIVSYLPLLALVGTVIVAPAVADAQTITGRDLETLRVPIFNVQGRNVFELIARIIQLLLLVAGIVAFFYVLWGGFQYLTAGPDGKGADTGKKTITNAIIGIIIIAISYSLVSFVIGLLRDPDRATGTLPGASTQTGGTSSQPRTGNGPSTGSGTSSTVTGNNVLTGTVTHSGQSVNGTYLLRSGDTEVKSGSFTNGVYRISGIPAGTYQVFFSDDGNGVYDGTVTFSGTSETRTLNIQLISQT